jgi:dolichol kinase
VRSAALRRITHAATAAILVLPFIIDWATVRYVVLTLAVAWILIEHLRVRRPRIHEAFATALPVFREDETTRVSGAGWLMVGYAVAVWFPQPAATAGLLVAAFADPMASVIGTRFSRNKEKTAAGSLAFLVVAIAVLWSLGLGWPVVGAVAVVSTVLERWPLGLNDNLVVAPAVAAAVFALA